MISSKFPSLQSNQFKKTLKYALYDVEKRATSGVDDMKSWTPKIVFVLMTLLPVMLIAGAAFWVNRRR